MGVNIHVHILELDEQGTWQELKLFVQDKKSKEFKEVKSYDGRNSELFDILTLRTDGDFPAFHVSTANTSLNFVTEYKRYKEDIYYFHFYEANLADIKNYLNEHPVVRDYDKEAKLNVTTPHWKFNPVTDFLETIITYADLASEQYYIPLSSRKIVYWFG